MAEINYSGSQSITGCTITTWTDTTYYSFKLTQDCKIAVGGTPSVSARAGQEFVIQVNSPYIFDRDTKVMLSYPTVTDPSYPKYSNTNAVASTITTGNDYTWFYRMVLDPLTPLSGYHKVTFGVHIRLYDAALGSQYLDFRLRQLGAVEKDLMPARRYWSPSILGSKYCTHSFIVNLELSEEYIFGLEYYAEDNLIVGSEDIPSKMIIEQLPPSTAYSGAYDLNYAHIEVEGYDTTAQDTAPYGLDFKSDGLKLYISGDGSNAIDQFTLSTAYSTEDGDVSYDGTFVVSTEEATVTDVTLGNSDGLMFICGSGGDEINSYTLSTPGVITSGCTARSLFSVSAQDTAPEGIAWTSDGMHLLMAGGTNSTIYQYDIATTAWDETDLTFSNKTISCSGTVKGVDISEDDVYVFVTYDDRVERYEITGGTFDIESLSAEVQGLNLNIITETAISGGRVVNSGKQFTYIGSTTEILKSIQLGYQDA